MIDKLKEFEGLSYSIGDFHDTSEESEQRLEQLRKEINQSIKLEEIIEKGIKELRWNWEVHTNMIKVLEESGNKTYINHKQKDI